ncbi:MAG: LamG domain-containing protein, partial [Clostridia bacterium]|nr:LamG domain-containing protein [Clostridia bacterium]
MKKASRVLSVLLSVLMVLSCLAGFTFAFAEDGTGYANNGLVALFDGKVGAGDKWVDRVNGYTMNVADNDKNGFNEEGYVNNSVKNYFPQELVDLVNGDEFTVELALGEFISIGGDFNTFLNSTNDRFALFRRVAKNELEFKFAGCGGDLRWTVADGLNLLQDSTVTVTYDADGITACYINGAKVTEKAAQGNMGADDLFIGQESNKAYETTYKSIRFYNRVLTD